MDLKTLCELNGASGDERAVRAAVLAAAKEACGDVRIDRTGKAAGRGAYVCDSIECLKKARKTRALERALECAIEAEVFDELERQISPTEAEE